MGDMRKGFLRVSHAANQLAGGMWGGLRRPEPVATIKRVHKKLSVGRGPWREQAAQRFRCAAVNGELVVYVVDEREARSENRILAECCQEKIEPVMVPVSC